MRTLLLIAALAASPAFADRKTCVESGERLYVEQPENADIQRAFRHCRPLAEAGDAEAQYYFATVFMFRTIRQPPASPVVEKWMKLSAENGYGKAQFYMATVYRFGNAVTERDAPKMLDMYEKAARNGVPPAPLELGRIWRRGGHGFPPDEAKAIHWYEFAAQKYRFRDAMQALVELYRDKDPAKARYWREQMER
ncbi:MAG: tetratricopeptide repeat protein [Betaproteobacteria bacterium]